MSLKYGLNVKKAAPLAQKRAVFDDDDDDDDEPAQEGSRLETISSFGQTVSAGAGSRLPPGRRRPTTTPSQPPSRRKLGEDPKEDISSIGASRAKVKAAEDIDPSIFDYDSFHDAKASVAEAKKEALRQDAIDRKPKYINNLLDAAARRKQDQLIAREKLLQREREAEGDEFADKEKFVTGAYKEQQEEARRLEEEEKRRAEEDEKRKRKLGGGMQGFYKTMMDQTEKQHQEAVEAAEKLEREGGARAIDESQPKDADLVAAMRAKGVKVDVNDEGQVTDKRQLLSAGLNVGGGRNNSNGSGALGRGSDHLKTSNRAAHSSAFPARDPVGHQASRERQSRMMEDQLAERAKRAREEEEEERVRLENAAKSTKTTEEVSDARARFLARKKAKEAGGK